LCENIDITIATTLIACFKVIKKTSQDAGCTKLVCVCVCGLVASDGVWERAKESKVNSALQTPDIKTITFIFD